VLASPERFREVAARFSDGDFKRRGGDMGFVPKSGKPGVDQVLVDKAFAMETNQISQVFKTDEGFNILMVAKKRERHDRTFQQVRGAVLRKLKTDKMTELLDAYVAILKQKTSFSMDDSVLDGVVVESVQRPGSRLDAAPSLSPQGAPSGDDKALRGIRIPQMNPNGSE
jgi:peptidyl-prolyl cis-trans isomerase C